MEGKIKPQIITKILRFFIFSGAIVIVLGFFGEHFFLFDLLSHFYFLYTGLGIILFLFACIIKDKLSFIVSFILLLFLFSQIFQADIFVDEYTGETDIFYLNSNYFINETDAIIKEIEERSPEYVMMVEINEPLHEALKAKYKYNVYHSDREKSLGFYTNTEILSSKVHELTYPFLEVHTRDLSALIVHPLPPFTTELSTMQQENFAEISDIYNRLNSPRKMIVGDFNSTFYSPVFKKYFGKLYYTPIYSWGGMGPLRMPIDYAIGNTDFFEVYSSDFEVSDHLPLYIDLK